MSGNITRITAGVGIIRNTAGTADGVEVKKCRCPNNVGSGVFLWKFQPCRELCLIDNRLKSKAELLRGFISYA